MAGEAWLSVSVAITVAFLSAFCVILLAIFPFRKEVFHCIGKRYGRDKKKTHFYARELSEV
jgi:hypothetical protein